MFPDYIISSTTKFHKLLKTLWVFSTFCDEILHLWCEDEGRSVPWKENNDMRNFTENSKSRKAVNICNSLFTFVFPVLPSSLFELSPPQCGQLCCFVWCHWIIGGRGRYHSKSFLVRKPTTEQVWSLHVVFFWLFFAFLFKLPLL